MISGLFNLWIVKANKETCREEQYAFIYTQHRTQVIKGSMMNGRFAKEKVSIRPVSLNRCPRNNGHCNEYETEVGKQHVHCSVLQANPWGRREQAGGEIRFHVSPTRRLFRTTCSRTSKKRLILTECQCAEGISEDQSGYSNWLPGGEKGHETVIGNI